MLAPQAGSPVYDAVAASLESAACCLQVLAAPGLPQQLYREELVTGLVTLAKYHIQYNLLVMHDVKYRRMYRPSSLAPDDAEQVRHCACAWYRMQGTFALAGRWP